MAKTNLRKVSIPVLILCCVSLISIGFAAWVITIPTSDGQEGNIKVEEVQTRAIEFTTKWYDSNEEDEYLENEIIFGAPASSTSGWLISNNQINTGETDEVDGSTLYKEAVENLSVVLVVTFTKGTKADLALYDFVFDFVVDNNSLVGYNKLLSEGYIAEPKFAMSTDNATWKEITKNDPNAETYINTVFNSLQEAALTNAADDATLKPVYIKVSYDWGSYFNPSKYAYEGETNLDDNTYNPYVYFNQKLYKRNHDTKQYILTESGAKQLIGASDLVPGSITDEDLNGKTYAEEAANVLNAMWENAGSNGKGINFVLTFGAKTEE